MEKKLNVGYGCINGTYWMYYGVALSFASAFLLTKGYKNAEIGVILAIGNILAVVLQPVLADIADKSKKISSFEVAEIVSVALMVMSGILMVFKGSSMVLTVVFIMVIGWSMAVQPLINALTFKIMEAGINVNFGVCRAVGSLAYAILTWILGLIVDAKGGDVVPVAGVIVLIMLFLSLFTTKLMFNKAPAKAKDKRGSALKSVDNIDNAENERINLVQFAGRNKLFLILNLGTAGVFFSNAILNSFMLQIVENVGGNSADMGSIFSVMAFLELPALIFFERIRKKFSYQLLLKVASICFVLKIALIWIAKDVTFIYVAHVFQTFSFALFLPAMVGFIGAKMSKGESVKGQALYTAMVTLSSVFASVVGGMVLDASGASMMLLISVIVTLAGALIVIFSVDKR